MTRYLLLVDGPVVGDVVRNRLSSFEPGSDSIHVVVPARDLSASEQHMVDIEEGSTSEEKSEVIAARWRLRSAIDTLTAAGFGPVTGDVGDPNPVDAVERALEIDRYDTIVVVSKPIGVAGWVHLDLPHRIKRHVSEPVILIEVELAHR